LRGNAPPDICKPGITLKFDPDQWVATFSARANTRVILRSIHVAIRQMVELQQTLPVNTRFIGFSGRDCR